ncbi:MAG: hypothetical protein PUP91_19450 [Rhizonema sp. PD37]|nr:hypothetical protein [Rhizonema sp. PD37]
MTIISKNTHIASVSEEKSGIETGGAIYDNNDDYKEDYPDYSNQEESEALSIYEEEVNSKVLDFLFSLNYAPGDLASIQFIVPKGTSQEKLKKYNLGYPSRAKDGSFIKNEDGTNKLIPRPVTGLIKLREKDFSFTRQIKSVDSLGQEFWIPDPKFKTYKNGAEALLNLNAQFYGVYFRANDHDGQHKDWNTIRCQSLFYECDGVSKQEQWLGVEEMRTAGFQETAVVETRHSLHVYYRIFEEVVEGWSNLQQRLIQNRRSDRSIHNTGRLMRLPGFLHWKFNKETQEFESYPIEVVSYNPDAIYSREAFDKFLPVFDKVFWNQKSGKRKHSSIGSDAGARSKSGEISEQNEDDEIKPWDLDQPATNLWDTRYLAPYQEGYQEQGRQNAITFQCPVHKGVSLDSAQVSISSGIPKCHAGCCSKELYAAMRKIAVEKGHPHTQEFTDSLKRYGNNFKPVTSLAKGEDSSVTNLARENSYRFPGDRPPRREFTEEEKRKWYEEKVEKEQHHLNTLTIKPEWYVIECPGKHFDDDLYQKIPESGLVLIHASMGIGKSRLVKNIVKKRFPERPLFAAAQTRSLSEIQSESLGATERHKVLEMYPELKGVSASQILQTTQNKITSCAPSFFQILNYDANTGERSSDFDTKGLILVIDEVRGVLDFLSRSSLADTNGNRAKNFDALKFLCEDAKEKGKLIICCDDSITNVESDYISSLAPDLPVTLIRSTYKKEPQVFTQYVPAEVNENTGEKTKKRIAQDQLYAELYADLEAKNRIIIACDGQTELEAIQKHCEERGFTFKRIDASVMYQKENVDFTKDINVSLCKLQKQVFGYTPTYGSGVNITPTRELESAVLRKVQLEAQKVQDKAAIAEVDTEIKYWEENWELGTPFFDLSYQIGYHLEAQSSMQLKKRERFCLPTKIWIQKHVSMVGCTSSLPSEQLRQLCLSTEGMFQLHSLAIAELQLQKDKIREEASDDFLEDFKYEEDENPSRAVTRKMDEILERIEKGTAPVPELMLYARERARECDSQKNRNESLRKNIENRGDILKVKLIEDANGSCRDEIKEVKDDLKHQKAIRVTKAPLLNDDQFKVVAKINNKTPEQQDQFDRYIFEKEFPQLLTTYDKKYRDEANNVALFYRCTVLDDRQYYMKAVKLLWQLYNRDALIEGDIKSIETRVKSFEQAKTATLQDLKFNPLLISFVREWGIIEHLQGHVFSADSLDDILAFVKTKTGKQRLKLHFQTEVPKDKKKSLIQWVNAKILSRFALVLELATAKTIEGEKTRYYSLVGTDIGLTLDSRKLMVESLCQKHGLNPETASFLPRTNPKSVFNQANNNIHIQLNLESYDFHKIHHLTRDLTKTDDLSVYIPKNPAPEKVKELPQAITTEPLYKVDEIVECLVLNTQEPGIILSHRWCPDKSIWIYEVDLADGPANVPEDLISSYSPEEDSNEIPDEDEDEIPGKNKNQNEEIPFKSDILTAVDEQIEKDPRFGICFGESLEEYESESAVWLRRWIAAATMGEAIAEKFYNDYVNIGWFDLDKFPEETRRFYTGLTTVRYGEFEDEEENKAKAA